MNKKQNKIRQVRLEWEAVKAVEDYKSIEPLSPTIPKLVNYAVVKFFTELKNSPQK